MKGPKGPYARYPGLSTALRLVNERLVVCCTLLVLVLVLPRAECASTNAVTTGAN